jgi:hypothetical protein
VNVDDGGDPGGSDDVAMTVTRHKRRAARTRVGVYHRRCRRLQVADGAGAGRSPYPRVPSSLIPERTSLTL